MGLKDDEEGTRGVFLTPDIPVVAQGAISTIMRRLAPKVMTWSQLAAAGLNMAKRAVWGEAVPPYAPCFADCIDHFALHPGIHAMLRAFMKGEGEGARAAGLGPGPAHLSPRRPTLPPPPTALTPPGLKLPTEKALPSYAALRDYGNTSAPSTWCVGWQAGRGMRAGLRTGAGGRRWGAGPNRATPCPLTPPPTPPPPSTLLPGMCLPTLSPSRASKRGRRCCRREAWRGQGRVGDRWGAAPALPPRHGAPLTRPSYPPPRTIL